MLIVASLLYLLQRWIAWFSTNFVVTTDRCIYREGIITKEGVEIPLERINTVFFHQGLIERMVRAGDLTIESAGEMGVQRFEDVRDPVSVQNVLYQEMEDNENRKFDRVRAPAPGPAAPGPTSSSVADELTKLVNLREQGSPDRRRVRGPEGRPARIVAAERDRGWRGQATSSGQCDGAGAGSHDPAGQFDPRCGDARRWNRRTHPR